MPHEDRERIRRLRAEIEAGWELDEAWLDAGSPPAADREQPAGPLAGAATGKVIAPLQVLVLATLFTLCSVAALVLIFLGKPLQPAGSLAPAASAGAGASALTIEPAGPIVDGIQLPAVAHLALEPAWQGVFRLDGELLKLNDTAAVGQTAGVFFRLEIDGAESGGQGVPAQRLGTDGAGNLAILYSPQMAQFSDSQKGIVRSIAIQRRLNPLCNPVVHGDRVFWGGRDRHGNDYFGCSSGTRQLWEHAAGTALLGVQSAGNLGIFVTTASADGSGTAQAMLYSPAGRALWQGQVLLRGAAALAYAPAVEGGNPALLYALLPSPAEPGSFELARLDPASAELRWQQRIDQPTAAGPYVLADGSVLLGAAGGKLEVFSATGVPVSALPAKALRLLPLAPVEHAGSSYALAELGEAYGGQAGRLAVLEITAGATRRLWLLNTRLTQPESMVRLGSKLLLGQTGEAVEALRLPPSSAAPAQPAP